jgi:hypothetical protein
MTLPLIHLVIQKRRLWGVAYQIFGSERNVILRCWQLFRFEV